MSIPNLEKTRRVNAKPSASRKVKFQADLVPAEDSMVRSLKTELEMTSNSDLLSDALTLFRWAVNERKQGHRILSENAVGERRVLVFPRLERVAPELTLPHAEIPWTDQQLEKLAELVTGSPAAPTAALIRAMRR